jgi:hypothetical protein
VIRHGRASARMRLRVSGAPKTVSDALSSVSGTLTHRNSRSTCSGRHLANISAAPRIAAASPPSMSILRKKTGLCTCADAPVQSSVLARPGALHWERAAPRRQASRSPRTHRLQSRFLRAHPRSCQTHLHAGTGARVSDTPFAHSPVASSSIPRPPQFPCKYPTRNHLPTREESALPAVMRRGHAVRRAGKASCVSSIRCREGIAACLGASAAPQGSHSPRPTCGPVGALVPVAPSSACCSDSGLSERVGHTRVQVWHTRACGSKAITLRPLASASMV